MKTSHFSINGIVDARDQKRPLYKGPLLAALLPVSMAFSAPGALAADAANGSFTTSDITVSAVDPVFQQLRSVSFNLTQVSRCVAVASANPVNPISGDNRRYTFGLALDLDSNTGLPNPERASKHEVEFDDALGEDQQNVETVSSTFAWRVPAGPHTIRWMASKSTAGNPNLRVASSQLSVMCFDNVLQ
jgi:hypothetical protein